MEFLNDYITYLFAIVPFIVGFVVYSELKAAGTPIFDSNGRNQIGTQVYIGHHVFLIK